MQQFQVLSSAMKWSEHSRPAHRFDTTSRYTISKESTKFYILLNVLKFNRYSFSLLKGALFHHYYKTKLVCPPCKSQLPTRPDPTQNQRMAASAAVFPDHRNIVVLNQAIINGHKVMHKDSVNSLY
jgi:hypothetical protein